MGRKEKTIKGDVTPILEALSATKEIYGAQSQDIDELYIQMYIYYRRSQKTKREGADFINASINTVNKYEKLIYTSDLTQIKERKKLNPLLFYVKLRELAIADNLRYREEDSKHHFPTRDIVARGMSADLIEGWKKNREDEYTISEDLDKFDIVLFEKAFSSILFTLNMAYAYWYARGFDFLLNEIISLLIASDFQLIEYNNHIYWTKVIPQVAVPVPRLNSYDIKKFRKIFNGDKIDLEERLYLKEHCNFELHGNTLFRELMENMGYVFTSQSITSDTDLHTFENPYYVLLNGHRDSFLTQSERVFIFDKIQELNETSVVTMESLQKIFSILMSMENCSVFLKKMRGLSEAEQSKMITMVMRRYGYTYNTVSRSDEQKAGWTALLRMKRYHMFRQAYLDSCRKTNANPNDSESLEKVFRNRDRGNDKSLSAAGKYPLNADKYELKKSDKQILDSLDFIENFGCCETISCYSEQPKDVSNIPYKNEFNADMNQLRRFEERERDMECACWDEANAVNNELLDMPKAKELWECPKCHHKDYMGKFCSRCGSPKPINDLWECPSCHHQGNRGKFCEECGSPKPINDLWECPSCHHQGNRGKFCEECGSPKQMK